MVTIDDFKERCGELGISPNAYSLYEGLKSDALILDMYNEIYEVKYMDEKGDQKILGLFNNQSEALEFIIKEFEFEKLIENSQEE